MFGSSLSRRECTCRYCHAPTHHLPGPLRVVYRLKKRQDEIDFLRTVDQGPRCGGTWTRLIFLWLLLTGPSPGPDSTRPAPSARHTHRPRPGDPAPTLLRLSLARRHTRGEWGCIDLFASKQVTRNAQTVHIHQPVRGRCCEIAHPINILPRQHPSRPLDDPSDRHRRSTVLFGPSNTTTRQYLSTLPYRTSPSDTTSLRLILLIAQTASC